MHSKPCCTSYRLFWVDCHEICSWIPAPRRKVRIWRQLLWNTCAHSALCTLHVEQSWQWIRQATGGLAGNIFTYACYKLFFRSTAKIHNEPGHILTCICSLPGALLGGGSMECFVNNLCLACGRTMRFSWKRWSSYQLIVKLFDLISCLTGNCQRWFQTATRHTVKCLAVCYW